MSSPDEIYKLLCEIKADIGELKGEFKSHVETDKGVAKDVKELRDTTNKWKWGVAGALGLGGAVHVSTVWGAIKAVIGF